MEGGTGGAQDERVPRLVILWTRPDHLTREEADAWVRLEVARLGIPDARLAEVEPAALEHPVSWRWMLELELVDRREGARRLSRGPVADWLRDMRLLGMRPTVMLVGSDGAPEAAA
jgi:hypothetical protein